MSEHVRLSGQRNSPGFGTKAVLLRENVRKALLYLRPMHSGWRQAITDPSDPLGPYPLDFERFLIAGHYTLVDETGLPVSCDGYSSTHNYTRICGWGFAHWSRYLRTRSEQDLRPVLMASDYMLRTADWCDMGLALRGEVSGQGHVGPVSAMSQGQAMSVLLRSFRATGQEVFLKGALGCLGSFHTSVDDGGVVSHDLGLPWFEEYTSRPLAHVLNGMIFALWGLSELAATAPGSAARCLWLQGLRSLEALCERFDCGWWSAYSVGGRGSEVASIGYHSLHIAQLRALGAQTGSRSLQQLADRFAVYGRDPVKRVRAGAKLLRSKLQRVD